MNILFRSLSFTNVKEKSIFKYAYNAELVYEKEQVSTERIRSDFFHASLEITGLTK
jgi:hypothetical protein